MTLHHKRPRTHAGIDVLPGPYSSPVADLELSQYPLAAWPYQEERETATHAYATSTDLPSTYEHSCKRIRPNFTPIDTMPSSRSIITSPEDYLGKEPTSHLDQQSEQAHASYPPAWTVSAQSLQYPLNCVAQLLCPGCGVEWDLPSGEYRSLPQVPEVAYNPSQPYSMQEAPSARVQNIIPVSEHIPCTHSPVQQTSVGCDQQTPQLSPLESYPILDQLPFQPSPVGELVDVGYQTEYQTTQLSTQPISTHHVGLETQPHIEPVYHQAINVMSEEPAGIHYGPPMMLAPDYNPTLYQGSGSVDIDQCGNMIHVDGLPSQFPMAGWRDVAIQGQGSNFDIWLPNQRGGKRGPFRDQSLRKQTAQTRKIGSCIRCRMQRIRCEHNPDDPNGGCLTCKKVANTKAGRFPCLRYKIPDIRLYKPGQVPGFEWTRRWNNNISDPIQTWASSETKVIRISEGYSDNKSIEFRVREFVPQEGDKLERTWDFNGTKKSVAIPPYALMDLEDGKAAYGNYIRECMSDTFQKVLGRRDGLLYKTYLQAWHICREPNTPRETLDLLTSTLRLWVAIRLSTTSTFIVGEETLGMPSDIMDSTSPNHGKIPVPPVLGAQMDLILIHHIQTKLRRAVLDKLQKIILKNKQSNWLVTYLVTFILLHNAALITAHDARYAKKHGMKRRFAREDKVQEYHLGANILLAHFHYCNKGVHPFSDECKDQDLRALADLDDKKIQFVRATRAYAKRHKEEWEQVRAHGNFENDYFFVSQLFEEGWHPRSTDS